MTAHPIKKWAAAYKRGQSFRQIAAGAGVDESTVRRALAGKVEPRRGPRRKPVTAAEVVRAYEAAGSIRGAEAALGCSETLVRIRLFEAGVIDEHPDQRPRKSVGG